MVKIHGNKGVYLLYNRLFLDAELTPAEINQRLQQEGLAPIPAEALAPQTAKTGTITYGILMAHNTSGDPEHLKLKFDALASHDITYVGIIQTAKASGLKEFPLPYVLTNCHNSLCMVGGTINEDDHVFGLSAARRYGGIFVPAHQAVIHQYMREMFAGGGRMILGSDSHTRYGPLGTMGIGEGGPELVKQLVGRTYDLVYPEVIAVYLEGEPAWGVGPQDVALALIKAVFAGGYVKNKVLEFIGPGVANLSVDYRNGIDVMTTETTCLSSIWQTDEQVAAYLAEHGRPDDYRRLEPATVSYYDGLIRIDLSKIEPMIALPFHPSNAYSIREFKENAGDILAAVEAEAKKLFPHPEVKLDLTGKVKGGAVCVDQGVVAGCAGGSFENLWFMAEMMAGKPIGNGEFALSVYPASQPINLALINQGAAAKLLSSGVTLRTAFCGPCFGAGDIPANGMLSIRHTTRNFPNREGSKPRDGQLAAVALMDARSIAATAMRGGVLTAANELELPPKQTVRYHFDPQIYAHRVYNGYGKADPSVALKYGPNIADWPEMIPLPDGLILKLAAVITDPVTTTDELIPSGETSSYRSNPLKLAEFTLSRKEPGYVPKAKAIARLEEERRRWTAGQALPPDLAELFAAVAAVTGKKTEKLVADTGLGSAIFAVKPGDGSAREQAASCQKVLGGWANLAIEYATKRYRSNLINWGMLPFTIDPADQAKLTVDSILYIPGIRAAVCSGAEEVTAYLVPGGNTIRLKLENLSPNEREIILAGSLINYYAVHQ
ncbi:MAG TPA: hydratase [Firmicutes bacterium]|uniref:Hydratase n=1 Tax=Capillibacterium thermochitinicola TaxID=2699427 RepID=A0A8J6HZ74_9FIRM|nr:hydratase [Capillibacterium thermochitinicola]MBA2132521.1 hydratase [Capillibacterium thermochitinicola]HHW11521.1 hydratase [Bacillota bacterium]